MAKIRYKEVLREKIQERMAENRFDESPSDQSNLNVNMPT
jgi:hypothetical protein